MSTSPFCAPPAGGAKTENGTSNNQTIQPELLEKLRAYVPLKHPLIRVGEVGRAYVHMGKHGRKIIIRIRNEAAWHTVHGDFKGFPYQGEFSETPPDP
jgi:hypothetical protein